MGPTDCPETPASKYQSTLRNVLYERSDLHRGGSLKHAKKNAAYCYHHTQHTTAIKAQNAVLLILNLMADIVTQEYTNFGRRVTRATKFCTVAPNVCGPSVWKLHSINCLTPKNFDVAPRFFKKLCTPALTFFLPWCSSLPSLPSGPGPTHCRVFMITFSRTPLEE